MTNVPPEEKQPTQKHPQPHLRPRRPVADRIPAAQSGEPLSEDTVKRPPPDRTEATRRTMAQPRDGTKGKRRPPQQGGFNLPWWSFVIVILVVAGITCGLWVWVLTNRGDASTSAGPTPTPIFVVITATPTLGSDNSTAEPPTSETNTVAPTSPLESPTPPRLTTTVDIGVRIAIQGTEGDGLAIRQGPGTDYTFFFVAYDGETFMVEDGPREGNGYTWWYIVDAEDPDRAGWAAADFLTVVP